MNSGLSQCCMRYGLGGLLSVALGLGLMTAAVPVGLALDDGEQLLFADGVYGRGMWDVAVKEYTLALTRVTNTPLEAMVLYRLGECSRALGRTNDAERFYLRSGAVPAGGDYRFRAGLRRVELLDATGRAPDAVQLAAGLVQSGPTGELAAACQFALGSLQERGGRTNEAAAAYETIVERHARSSFVSLAALALGNLVAQRESGSSRGADLYRLAATNAAGPRVAAEAWFQLGELYFRQRQFEQSTRAYERLLSLYPTDERVTDSRLQLAWASHHAGLYASALTLCETALKAGAGEREAEWLYLKANCERQLLQNDAAIQSYTRLLQRHSAGEMADLAGYEKALVWFKMGRHAEAIQQAKTLPPNPRIEKDTYWLLAESGAALKDDALAVQYYRLLADKFPRSDLAADAMYRLAHLLQKKGEFPQAAEWFKRLVGDFPTNALTPQALFAAGLCESKAGRNEAAVRDWGRLIEAYPGSRFMEEALYQKAVAETQLKQDEKALATWRDLLRRYPASRYLADAHFWSAVLCEERGRLEEAEAGYRSALKAAPAAELEARVRFRLALVLQRRQQPDESAALLQGLLATGGTNTFGPELLEWLTDYHLGRKDYAKAAESAVVLTRQATGETWQQIAWCLQGKALQGAGRGDEARTAFEKVVALSAKTQAAAEAWLRLGDLALQTNGYANARGAFEKAVMASSADTLLAIRVQAYAGLARLLKAQGDWEGAARHFLSVGLLFDDPVLVPECLHEAAQAYAKLGRVDDSTKVINDLLARYPESEWAKRYRKP
jgi:TolA-binding protein